MTNSLLPCNNIQTIKINKDIIETDPDIIHNMFNQILVEILSCFNMEDGDSDKFELQEEDYQSSIIFDGKVILRTHNKVSDCQGYIEYYYEVFPNE